MRDRYLSRNRRIFRRRAERCTHRTFSIVTETRSLSRYGCAIHQRRCWFLRHVQGCDSQQILRRMLRHECFLLSALISRRRFYSFILARLTLRLRVAWSATSSRIRISLRCNFSWNRPFGSDINFDEIIFCNSSRYDYFDLFLLILYWNGLHSERVEFRLSMVYIWEY